MSQAFNLSQFANKVNTSGQADLTTAVTGTLPKGNGGTGLTTPGTSGNVLMSDGTDWVSGTIYATRNRIINGAMTIDQRNAGASVTPANGAVTYTLDRYAFFVNQASKLTAQQNAGSVTPPVGFTNYLGVTSSSAYSSGASDIFVMYQFVEGYNIADLGWGTANAKTVTLSFWVRSSLTGTHSGAISNAGNSRSYPFSFTISSANTWTQISVTIPGDTTGTWLTTNGAGLSLKFNCGCGSSLLGTANAWAAADYAGATGSVSLVGTSGATLYITGVQLEQGSTATPFERRLYGQEFLNCQRYYVKTDVLGNGNAPAFNNVTLITQFPVIMRASPTISVAGTTWAISDNFAADANTSSPTIAGQYDTSATSVRWAAAGFTGLTAGRFYNWRPSTTSLLNISAEL